MNFLTHDAAYSLYPHLTFHDFQAIYFPSDYTDGERDFVRKYENLGWTISNYRNDVLCNCISTSPRRIADQDCWVISLNDPAKSAQVPDGPFSLFHQNSWRFRWTSDPNLQFTRVASHISSQEYTIHLNFFETIDLANTIRRKRQV